MADLKSVGEAVANLDSMRLRLIHSLLYTMQAKDLLALRAKSKFLKEEPEAYFQAIMNDAKAKSGLADSALKLDVFLGLSKLLKLPAARLNEKEKVRARSAEIENKWFDRQLKKDRDTSSWFDHSHVPSRLECMLHLEYAQLLDRFLKNEKVIEGKEPFLHAVQRCWDQLPDYQKVQIYERLQAARNTSFMELAGEYGTERLLFEMGTRVGFSMYHTILPPVQEDVPLFAPRELWILHPDAFFTTEGAVKTLLSNNWMLSAALLLLYVNPGGETGQDESVLSKEWITRESAYLLLLRQINELQVEERRLQEEVEQTRHERLVAQSNRESAQAVYENLRERLIVLLKTDAARPYLGDSSIANTRLREKQARLAAKLEANRMRKSVFHSAGAWAKNLYLQNEKAKVEKKLQLSFERMADDVLEKYPYYEAELIAEVTEARTIKNGWQFESDRLRKKESQLLAALSDLKNEELQLRETAAESASKTAGLKQIDLDEEPAGSSPT